ncbi:MAG: ABC transporter substrate-binding protein [Sterolibacterium sp.]|nr:ABC transporter substrate-binding protein [Sterolibacterium sp.]
MNPKYLVLLLLAWFAALVQAQTPEIAPDVLVKNVTDEVLQIIRSDKDIQAGNSKKAMELIEAKVQQHFNFTHMTQLGVGRDWKNASAAQQKQLADEFHTLLVRTYAKALTEYKSQTIAFKPFKMNAGDTDVKVRTQVNQAGSKAIPLDYYLEKLPAGWKVYDIEVEGISLVINYRESFAAEVRSGGIDGLIKSLQNKNKTGASESKKG